MGVSATAEARAVHYRSQHPLPRKIGHGFCYINVPHVHDFGPSDPRLYREVNGEYYFVGDPAPFDYEGPRYSFYGPHPVVDAEVQFGQPVYCYLNGPHFHGYQPPPQAQFEFRGGAYWYVGNYDPVYYQDRPRYVTVNAAYQPIAYTRPVVDVTVAPPSFHGEIFAGPGGARGGGRGRRAGRVGRRDHRRAAATAGPGRHRDRHRRWRATSPAGHRGRAPRGLRDPRPPRAPRQRTSPRMGQARARRAWLARTAAPGAPARGWLAPGAGAAASRLARWREPAAPAGRGWRPAPAAPPQQHHEKHGEPHGNGWHR